MNTLMRFLGICTTLFMIGVATARTVDLGTVANKALKDTYGSNAPQLQEKTKKHEVKTRSVAPVYLPPVYSQKEFQYFVEGIDNGNLANASAELRQLLLAPKFDLRMPLKDKTDVAGLKKFLSEKYGAKVTIESASSEFVHFVLRLPSDTKQERLVELLNALMAESDGMFDVVPVFYVDHRQAVVSGIIVTFAVPFSKRQLEQMLENYGGFQGFDVKEDAHGLSWKITSTKRRFALESLFHKDGTTLQGKFDTHLLLLANLLETQKLLKGVAVVSARPEWTFLEGPITARLSILWPADTVGGVRLLRLTVTISDGERVRFDPSKVPLLGSPGFELRTGPPSNGNVIPGWSKLADGGKITEKNQWTVSVPREVVTGGRSFTVYTLSRQFYIFQPEALFSLNALSVPYEYKANTKSGWKPMNTTANAITFATLPHQQNGETLAMPMPPAYAFPRSTREFVVLPELVRGVNEHWFSQWVERGKEWSISIEMIEMSSFVLIALAGTLLLISGLLFNERSREMNTRKQRAIPFMGTEEFTERLRGLSGEENSVEGLLRQMILCRKFIEELLVARIPKLSIGQVTTPMLKETFKALDNNDPRFKSVLERSLKLLLLTNMIDAPKELFSREQVSRELETLRGELPAFYAELAQLPPRMSS